MRTSPARLAGSVGVVALLTLGAVACSDDDSSSGSSGTADSGQMGSGTTMAGADGAMMALTEENLGEGCAAVPTSGPGSFSGMADDPAATAASNNPVLSTLVSAVGAAGLADTLNGPGPFTIFAPTNDAFAKIPANTMSTVMADPSGALTKILTYHVVSGDYDAADLVEMETAETVEGSEVTIALEGDTVEINGQSAVICGNVQVGNGTVHIIDTVLMPEM
jgi:transforming growth factor-beta-induced protein